MDKIDKYHLNLDSKAIWHIEQYIEGLFRQWPINEIYLANVVTCFSNLIHLLLVLSENEAVSITTRLKDEVISFDFTGVDPSVLKYFLKEHHLQDIQDNSTQAVFLIQKITDEIVVEGENLILRFNSGALPEAYLDNRNQTLNDYYQNTPQKAIND
jgi:predicted NACHT family NTPase